jgi:hypothetical protein
MAIPRHNRSQHGVLGRALALAVLCGVGVLAPAAHAQLLADVMVSTAISAKFDPSLSLPRGTLRAVGKGTEAVIARVPDRDRWTDWEVYEASGLLKSLQAGYVHNIETAFAVDGYFQSDRTEQTVGAEDRTHIVFQGNDGERLLYVIRTSQEVVWLTARSK